MTNFEYVVVPAPRKAPKIKGAKTSEARFAHTLTEVMNAYGAEGWEYLRCDTLPCEERSGLTGTKTVYQNMLVFRRVIEETAHDIPEADRVQTPEQLAAELAPAAPAPSSSQAPATPEEKPAAPRLSAARTASAGPAPRLGPAATESGTRVHPFPLSGAERFEKRDD
ncbi:DUF4177 domain-containing protein [Oceaniglobus trochenteri]|uniref:DUF4177 domain-containing protein n=1 Tax=Oceaniglobus trochenteri TaxID=2763260 RepID=UPI001CFFDBAB|nr:DUF4177 domain-containing protein [Oceaniglobus trochenteri]